MKLCRLLFALALLLSLSAGLHAQDQKMVLFETFTNSYINCPAINDFDAQFKQTLLPSNPNSQKIIHLNYHVTNVGDPMAAASPSATNAYYQIVGTTNVISIAAVDRTIFTSSDQQYTSSKTEWDQRITARVGQTPPVSLKLASLQIDKLSSDKYARLIAKVDVTSQQNLPDSMALHFAIAQDNLFFAQCPDAKPPGPTKHNDVVRYVTIEDSLMDFKAKTKNTVTYSQDISKTIKTFVLGDMKLIAFAEDIKGGDHQIVQSALLQMNLDDLPAPPASLLLDGSILDDAIFAPGDLITINFDKVSIDSVKVEYSLDDGGSWHLIGVTHEFRMYWNAPGTVTTKGKIRISDMKNGSLTSTEGRTFTIKQAAHSLSILRPNADDIVYIGQKFNVTWNQFAVDTLWIEYSKDDGSHWQSLFLHKGGPNTYQWNVGAPYVTGASPQARMRLRPNSSDLATLTSTSDAFQVLNTNVGLHTSSRESFHIAVNPQPVKRSDELKLNLSVDSYSGVDISLYDMSGKKVLSKDRAYFGAGNNTMGLDLHSLAAGTYILEVKREDGAARVVKVVAE